MIPTFAFPAALLLAIPALGLLVLFRLLRSKRRRIVAGSLLIWNRLAAQPATAKPKRIVFDRSFFLQAIALSALVISLAGIRFVPEQSTGKTVLLVIDNGTLTRRRSEGGTVTFGAVVNEAKALLNQLKLTDKIVVARTAPSPMVMNSTPVNPSEAIRLIEGLVPAISGPDAASIRLFAVDRARTISDRSVANVIVSLLDQSVDFQTAEMVWRRVDCLANTIGNVGIVDAGAVTIESKNQPGAQVLVRVANYADGNVSGRIVLESMNSAGAKALEQKECVISARSETVAAFRIAPENKDALRISWRRSDGLVDSFPEDDAVVLASRPVRAPRIRFHAPHAALEKLFRLALNAEIISSSDSEPTAGETDLDVYVGSVPERLSEPSRAALFVAPERGYRSFYEVGGTLIQWPAVERGDESALTTGIVSGGTSGIAIPKSYDLLRTGDFAVLLREVQTGRIVASRFMDERARPCYVLAFSPGDGLPVERALDPGLAAMLVRIALEASRAGPPYVRMNAADFERAGNQPLPMNWTPSLTGEPPMGVGVLDERISNMDAPKRNGAMATAELDAFLKAPRPSSGDTLDLVPFFLLLSLVCAAVEVFTERVYAGR
ncbi:MAG: hypothetical protein WCT04_14380 [Planctomycetota bacterium]